ncbi:MAG: glycosyltransferase family 2 protein [Bacteroidales bacterium]|nr:glycosyltransferase family 2 protein [Bacteroidales bacterium]
MLISILIAAYNVEKYLDDCLNSCINQTYRDIEVIVVNDGSTDNTRKIAEHYALNDNRVKVINKENGGLVSARKTGVEVANGDYVFFLDGDDNLPVNSIYSLVQKVVNSKNVDIVFGKQRIINPTNNSFVDRGHIVNDKTRLDYLNSVFCNANPNIVGHLFKKNLVIKINFHCDLYKSIGEDLVSIVQLIYFAKFIDISNEISYNYIRRDGSITQNSFSVYSKGFDAIVITFNYLIKFKIIDQVLVCFLKPLKTFILGFLISSEPFGLYKEDLKKCIEFMHNHKLELKLVTTRNEQFILFLASINLWLARYILKVGINIKKINS